MAATLHYIELNNQKIPLIFEEDKRLPLVNVQFVFQNAGSITNTQKAGLARFSAKMLNQGTKKLGSSGFAQELEQRAIHISSTTGIETFVTEIGSLKEQFDEALGFYKDLLKDPNFTQESLKKLQTITIGSITKKENDFDYIASKGLKKLLFEGTVLAKTSLGTVESVKSFTLNDVEEFIAKHLNQSQLIVVAGGDIELDEIVAKLKPLIALLPQGKKEALPFFEASKEVKERIVKRNTQQAYIYFGSPYNLRVNDEQTYIARVATFILGTGGFGSRLMEEIRVKQGLAYSAYARVNLSNSSSYFSGYLQTKIDSLEQAQKSVKEVIEKFLKEGVTKEELEQTKKFLLGSEPLRSETLSQRLQRSFMEYYKGFELGHSKKELEKINSLTLDELNSYIKKHTEITQLSFSIVTQE